MRALDLFCGAGGVSMGLHRAGFEVVGVDIKPQPRYPFEFHQAEAMTYPLDGFDFIWASPPCQQHTSLRSMTGKVYPCFIASIRERLRASGRPYVIENVDGAPLEKGMTLRLCGTMFGLRVWRHRFFEFGNGIYAMGLPCQHYLCPEPLDVTGTGGPGGRHRKPKNLDEAREAMGINWMTRRELSQAIPPAYSEYIGHRISQVARKDFQL